MTAPTSPPRPLELTRLAAEHLAARGIEDPRLDAELLLAHVLGLRRLDLYLQFERPLEPPEVDAFREAVRRRSAREPLQYITGEVGFRELTLAVDSRVLIPRPETEVLVGEVLAWAGAAGAGAAGPGAARGTAPGTAAGADRVLDLGTGSGAIALSLLREGPFDVAVATDSSEAALAVAAANAERCGLADRLELRHGPLWAAVGGAEEFRVIVSNPPYVADGEAAELAPEIRDHEPRDALLAGPDGLSLIREIVAGAPGHLVGGGLLAVEVGLGQADAVAELFRSAGFGEPRVAPDLTGRDRMVLGVYD